MKISRDFGCGVPGEPESYERAVESGPPGALKAKIVCTLGPASREPEVLRRMVAAGMNVARINSGHCDIDEVASYVKTLGAISEEGQSHVGIMLDLQGPRLRVGPIQGAQVELKQGQRFVISTEQKRGNAERVSVSYPGLVEDLKPGDPVLIDDGIIRLVVHDIKGNDINCTVQVGGTLLQGKGMNFPGAPLRLPSFTERDRKYLEAGIAAGIDWVSQSFVRTGDDVRALREALTAMGQDTPIMAKVEKGEAVENIDEVIAQADGVMVARGDLGVEMNAEDVPLVQKELISKALQAAKPVVTATQMLESMVHQARPTRAEASDVANAILDGTDAVMLSAETAVGAYPVQSVEMMARIAARTEQAIDYDEVLDERGRWAHCSPPDALGYSACKIAADLGAACIIAITRRGHTARLIARYRPASNVIAVSRDQHVIDRLAPLWGVRGLVLPLGEDLSDNILAVVRTCKDMGYVEAGDLVVVVGGFLHEKVGTTNMINLHTVE